jgi:hypothetical protein
MVTTETMRRVTLALLASLLACVKPTTPDVAEPPPAPPTAIDSEPATEVSLQRLSEGLWLHTSTRELDGSGRFPSHGLVVEHERGPLLIDRP